tara:strand:- start:621 stop:1502 length:882 start_codon:yes stop_codon:yes gene_type:complete
MKLLIQNYSNSCSNQPMYLNECLSKIGVDSKIWNPGVDPLSVYDKLDSERPDILLTSFQTIHQDLVSYLTNNDQINVVVDITGIDQNIFNNLNQLIENQNINCAFFITQDYKFLTNVDYGSRKVVNMLPCLDVFAAKTSVPDYNIQAAIVSNRVSNKFSEACGMYETYHKIALADNPDPNFDIQANVLNMNSLYEKYEEVVLAGDVNFTCSQIFFDGFIKSKKLTVKVPDEQKELFNNVLATLFRQEEEAPSLENIKNQIKSNHNCFNRASQFAKELGEADISKTLLEVAKQI